MIAKSVVRSAKEMRSLGAELARDLADERATVRVIELIGDVGAGKTTLVQGLAAGLGVKAVVTSPTFTISKDYETAAGGRLVHYDFYRLETAGIMRDEVAENVASEDAIVVVEWAETVKDVLPVERLVVRMKYLTDGTREVMMEEGE
ncbi:tRNA (adenosine(37)-N6)-threonylcarbamoyltransferase complex ATPase subunit type 1 TsaE [Candidatus Saccharibacteria bacterium]|nr:tRNA (adenosine(37)-N6)-threonylcarbamoyltransferase complex ATPase subunit type 1 TsaE [Candidatus Saccharibacteria bacterium]